MSSRNPFSAFATAVCAITLAVTLSATAEQVSLPDLVKQSISAMNAGKWEEALSLNTRAVTAYGKNNPLQIHGPKFGDIYYRKGLCELKLRKNEDAMKSFETCYREFPNREGATSVNRFNKLALLRWAEAAVAAGKYEEALPLFQKFLNEHDKEKDKFSRGSFHVAMAIAHYGLGRIPEGNEHFETAIKNRLTFPTTDNEIISGFQKLVTSAISTDNEDAILDFIQKNRHEIMEPPFLMHRYAKLFLRLAGEAIAAKMDRAAMALYQFVPSTDAAIEELRYRIKLMGPLERATEKGIVIQLKDLQSQLAALEEERRGDSSNEMTLLAATAFVHERNNNVGAAHAAYQLLENFHNKSAKREDNLYNLIRTSSIVGASADTLKHADTFVSEYPDSRHIPDVRRLMLASTFYNGKYQTCIEIAAPLLPTLEVGTPQHDLCLHVLGGSYYFNAEFEKAQPLLEQHVEKYPDSMFATSAAYFLASNNLRKGNYSKAAGLLDAFITKHSDPAANPYKALALFERATAHFNLDEHEPALEIISNIIRDHPTAVIIDQAYMLRGNIEESLDNIERAEQAYKTAYENAVRLNHQGIAGEALYTLVQMLTIPDLKRMKDALPYADLFWEKHAEGSPYRGRMAIFQFPALAAAGKSEEGLKRLSGIIAEVANSDDNSKLEELISSYTDAYMTKHTPQELKDHFYEFPGIRSDDSAARALLRVYVIRTYEGLVKKTQDEAEKNRMLATIKVLFQELKTDFDLKDLTTNTLLKVGEYLRKYTSTPREALPYYDEVLGRDDKKDRLPALLGRANVFATSTSEADIDKALADLETVYSESQESNEKEDALFRIVQLHFAKKDFEKAAEKAQLYLDTDKSGFARPKHAPEVNLILARTFDERKMVEDAIALYGKIYGLNTGNISVSAPALKRWMELLWVRNKPAANPSVPGDRQGAYDGGAKYIQNTSRFKAEMQKKSESDFALWQEVEKLVQTYQANPGIKSLEAQKREKEEAGR